MRTNSRLALGVSNWFAFESSPKTLKVSGKARNGLPKAITNLKIIVRLLKKRPEGKGKPAVVRTVQSIVRGQIEPGAVRPFSIDVADIGAYDDFEYEVGYEEGTGRVEQPTASGQVIVRVNSAVKTAAGGIEISGEVENTSAKTLRVNYLNIRDLLDYDKVVIPLAALDIVAGWLGHEAGPNLEDSDALS